MRMCLLAVAVFFGGACASNDVSPPASVEGGTEPALEAGSPTPATDGGAWVPSEGGEPIVVDAAGNPSIDAGGDSGMQTSGSDSGTVGSDSGSCVGCQSPMIDNCIVFPNSNEWNRDITNDAVDPNSGAYIAKMKAASNFLHPDFGSDPTYGIPWVTVPASQPKVPMSFSYPNESDPGPYPFPPNAPIEVGDAHVLVIDKGACRLYETYSSVYTNPGWSCASGAVFDLTSNALRPDGWTSADAAGLPIFPGLVKKYEVDSQKIAHALRFTVSTTQNAYVHPATHFASTNSDPTLPPMGLRVRLKASYSLSTFNGASLVILQALSHYGMFLADNGGEWFISGETNPSWDDNNLSQIKTVPATAFEVVKVGTIFH